VRALSLTTILIDRYRPLKAVLLLLGMRASSSAL
jgi:hypothetical protein